MPFRQLDELGLWRDYAISAMTNAMMGYLAESVT